MTIKSSLLTSIPIVKAFLTRNCLKSRRKWPKICVLGGKWGQNVKFCFLDHKRHILARNDVIWRIDRENRCSGLRCRLTEPKQLAQLSQRERTARWVSYGQKWKTVNGRQDFTDIIGLSSTTMMWLTSKAIEFGEKAQKRLIRRSRSFKVIVVGISRKPVCDFLLVINSN